MTTINQALLARIATLEAALRNLRALEEFPGIVAYIDRVLQQP
jgi:hypothetical protein